MAAPILILNVIGPCDMNEEFEDLVFSITVAADEESG